MHKVRFQDEYNVTKLFLKMEVGKNGKYMSEAILKICQLTSTFLQKPKLVLMDENAI